MTSTPSDDDEFAHIVRMAPLVSIDLIIRDDEQNVLVALRTNEPAKGFYFVPGGCIRKDETIENAFARILGNETGCRASFADARFLGIAQRQTRSGRQEMVGREVYPSKIRKWIGNHSGLGSAGVARCTSRNAY